MATINHFLDNLSLENNIMIKILKNKVKCQAKPKLAIIEPKNIFGLNNKAEIGITSQTNRESVFFKRYQNNITDADSKPQSKIFT